MKGLFFAALIAIAAVSVSADMVVSPSGNEWSAIFRTDAPSDIGNRGHEYLDIVGGTDANGVYFDGGGIQMRPATAENGLSEDLLFFRFRLDGIKNKMVGAYQVFFEVDGDSSVDWVLQLSTQDLETSGVLEFGRASGTKRSDVAIANANWMGDYEKHIGFTGQATDDGSRFNGDADYFLDMAMSWSAFSTNTGIQSVNSNFRVMMTTSQKKGEILDGDLMGTSSMNDVQLTELYAAVPEPAVVTLVMGFGFSLLIVRRIFGS